MFRVGAFGYLTANGFQSSYTELHPVFGHDRFFELVDIGWQITNIKNSARNACFKLRIASKHYSRVDVFFREKIQEALDYAKVNEILV